MPLVAHTRLPTFSKLRAQGQEVVSLERALHQDIRELHIGLLNMMPDAALAATELQYMRLIGDCNQIVQLFVYPFSVAGLPRSEAAAAYIDEHYAKFDQLRTDGLDALIISGANVTNPSIQLEPFWPPLQEVVAWAKDNVTSVLCSCLATHALVKHLYGIDRHPLPRKLWGVDETIALHAGYTTEPTTKAVAVPIYQTATCCPSRASTCGSPRTTAPPAWRS
jgi:homoserine O-succinyltransferase/O-acetyltransferase